MSEEMKLVPKKKKEKKVPGIVPTALTIIGATTLGSLAGDVASSQLRKKLMAMPKSKRMSILKTVRAGVPLSAGITAMGLLEAKARKDAATAMTASLQKVRKDVDT